jgi:hypothetical protein
LQYALDTIIAIRNYTVATGKVKEPVTSPYLLEAAARAASSARARDARVSAFLDGDLFLILAEPSRGEFYAPETEWPALTSKPLALSRLKECEDAAYVIFRPAAGRPKDVSEEFARAWLHELVAEGCDPLVDGLPRFISRHAVNIDVEEYLTDRREEAHLARQIRSLEAPRRV